MMFTAIASSLLLSGLARAQEVQSKPFNIVVQSDDKDLDGKALSACHSGAAIESLCITGDSGSEFYLNSTEGAQSPLDGYEASGALVWNLQFGGDEPSYESESMDFYIEPSTNVALPLFEPGYSRQYVSFSSDDDTLAIISYLDDTQTPPTGGNPSALDNWYVCQSYYTGYTYTTLNWVLGNAEPQNPSCKKVSVQRKFVE